MTSGLLRWIDRLADLPVRCPKRTLAALLLLSGLMGIGILRIKFDPSSERVFPENHWAVETFAKFRSAFGGDEAIYLAVESREGEDAFHPETLRLLRRLTRVANAVDGVDSAFSLADVPVLRLDPLMQPVLVDLLPEDPGAAAPEVLAEWKSAAMATPFIKGNLVSADERGTLVLIVLERLPSDVAGAEKNAAIVEAVEALVTDQERAGWTIRMAGTPIIKARIMGSIEGDLIVFSGPLLFIALAVSTLVLRSLRGTLLVLGVLLVTLDLTLGAMGHLGIAIDPMNTMVPVLIMVIGVADCLHLLVEQRAQAARLGPEADGATTVRAALDHVRRPCFLTSLTTAIGFGSLFTSDVRPVADFGVAAALASLAAFLVTMLLIPAAASLMAPPNPKAAKQVRADRLGEFVVRWPVPSLIFGVLFTVTASLGWILLEVDTNFLEFFREETRLRQDVETIQERFGGVAPAELLVDAPPGASRDPKVLQAMLRLERELETMDIVDSAMSVADVVAAAVGVTQGTVRIPDDPAQLAMVESVLERLAKGRIPLEELISPPGGEHPDREWLRIMVRARAVGSNQYGELVSRVEELGRTHLEPLGVKVTPTGTSVVFSQTADRIIAGQIESFFWAFISITIVMVISLRSLSLGLLSTIPNFVPIAALIGTMGYLGVPLNSFNSMVASIAIGIAVDDTIHILSGFKRFSAERPLREAVRETIAHEGAAILATSAVLFSGFCVLLLAEFVPTANFGILTGTAIAAALVGDLVLLPGILLLLPDRCPVGGGPAKEKGSASADAASEDEGG